MQHVLGSDCAAMSRRVNRGFLPFLEAKIVLYVSLHHHFSNTSGVIPCLRRADASLIPTSLQLRHDARVRVTYAASVCMQLFRNASSSHVKEPHLRSTRDISPSFASSESQRQDNMSSYVAFLPPLKDFFPPTPKALIVVQTVFKSFLPVSPDSTWLRT